MFSSLRLYESQLIATLCQSTPADMPSQHIWHVCRCKVQGLKCLLVLLLSYSLANQVPKSPSLAPSWKAPPVKQQPSPACCIYSAPKLGKAACGPRTTILPCPSKHCIFPPSYGQDISNQWKTVRSIDRENKSRNAACSISLSPLAILLSLCLAASL